MKSNHVYILGVNMSNHDRSACLLKNGEVLVAISEERLDRRKKSEGFYENNPRSIVIPPLASITYVLQEANISLDELDLVVCGRSINSCKNDFLSYFPIDSTKVVEISLPGHHLAHAYSAIGTAPFKEAAILVIDEQGHHLNGNFEKCSLYH
ncbi:carbamoyltransferase N-terminal domain-containing protein, partial [Escherichia coli]|uniref:carbamoyltransferase N-terminal domain-containing protein n=2 Tax=Bacteria TaxID=2 RepID=UPI0013CBF528